MEIRLIKYFLAVAETGSITKASNILHVSQPAISRQMQDLEYELGKQLFIRGKTNISLTNAGILFKKRAEEIIDIINKTEQEFKDIDKQMAGDIYIGSGESHSISSIVKIMKNIQNKFPDIKYHIQSGDSADIIEKLDKGILDFGLLIQPVDISRYNYLTLKEKDKWGLLMLKTNPLSKKEYIYLNDLINIPLITSRQLSKYITRNEVFKNWFQDKYDKLNIISTVNLVYNGSIMVKEEMGCALTLDKLIYTGIDSPFIFVPLYPVLESELILVWQKNHTLSKAANMFLDNIKKDRINFIDN